MRCQDVAGGFRCGACPEGYTGNGIQCEQLRTPCEPNPCYPGVRCVDYPGSPAGYRCGACPAGMEGDGTRCEARRSYCTRNPCYPGVDCRDVAPFFVPQRSMLTIARFQTQQAPFYQCGACPLGFRGNGTHCEDINEVDLGTGIDWLS